MEGEKDINSWLQTGRINNFSKKNYFHKLKFGVILNRGMYEIIHNVLFRSFYIR